MPEFYITPATNLLSKITAPDEKTAVTNFADNIKSDICSYFKAVPTEQIIPVIADNDFETIYDTGLFFNIYCTEQHLFRDGTANWAIGLELKTNRNKHLIIDVIRGNKKDAQRRCLYYMHCNN